MLEVVICDDDKEDLDKATLMLDKILSEYQVQYQICLLYTSDAADD